MSSNILAYLNDCNELRNAISWSVCHCESLSL